MEIGWLPIMEIGWLSMEEILQILFAKNPKPDLTPYLPWNWKAAQAQKAVVPSAPA